MSPEDSAPPPSSKAERPAGSASPSEPGASSSEDDLRRMLRELMTDDTVVATVDGKAILWGEVWRSVEALPADYQAEIDVLFPALLRRAVDMALLETAARREGLQNDPAVRRDVAAYEERLLREHLLRREIEAQVTQGRLQSLYQQFLAERAAAVEVTARHIQLNSRDAALKTIADLDEGADFADLARGRSRATSGERGGSLGTFRLDRMPPAFAAAIARLSPGQYSREPVQTEFGWHVILLERRVGEAPPTFAELAPQLRAEAERRVIDALLRDLRRQAQIEIMPLADGK